jgi:hypothetical protein
MAPQQYSAAIWILAFSLAGLAFNKKIKAVNVLLYCICIVYDYISGEKILSPSVPEYPWLESLISLAHLVFGSLVPFAIIVVCNIGIIVAMRTAASERKEMGTVAKNEKSQEQGTRHLTRMLMVVCAVYVVTSLPFRLYELAFSTSAVKQFYDMSQPYWRLRHNTEFHLLICIWDWNYGVNFYLYCIGGGQKYRQDVKALVKKIFCHKA